MRIYFQIAYKCGLYLSKNKTKSFDNPISYNLVGRKCCSSNYTLLHASRIDYIFLSWKFCFAFSVNEIKFHTVILKGSKHLKPRCASSQSLSCQKRLKMCWSNVFNYALSRTNQHNIFHIMK